MAVLLVILLMAALMVAAELWSRRAEAKTEDKYKRFDNTGRKRTP